MDRDNHVGRPGKGGGRASEGREASKEAGSCYDVWNFKRLL